MDIARLAAKQKRAEDWDKYSQENVKDPELKNQISQCLIKFRAVLVQCWKSQAVSPADSATIADLERQLEELNELARLVVTPRLANASGKKSKSEHDCGCSSQCHK